MSKGFGYKYRGTSGHIAGIASSLPNNPDAILKKGWTELSHPRAKMAGHRKFRNDATGLLIGFDKGIPGAPGFRGADHYHILNPHATSFENWYLDKNGKPVAKGSAQSHIIPRRSN